MVFNVKSFELQLKAYCCSLLFDADLDIKVQYQYSIEQLAHQLTAIMRVPADVLQDRAVIAEYPDGLWQHIKKALRLKYRRIQVRLNEHLVYPHITVPYNHAKYVRLYVQPDVRPVWEDE